MILPLGKGHEGADVPVVSEFILLRLYWWWSTTGPQLHPCRQQPPEPGVWRKVLQTFFGKRATVINHNQGKHPVRVVIFLFLIWFKLWGVMKHEYTLSFVRKFVFYFFLMVFCFHVKITDLLPRAVHAQTYLLINHISKCQKSLSF